MSLDKLRAWKVAPPVLALLLAIGLFFAGGLLQPGFVSVAQAINIVRLAAFLGMIAAGLSSAWGDRESAVRLRWRLTLKAWRLPA